MAHTGTVRDLSLPNLIQLYCNEGRAARLQLADGTRTGVIDLANGNVIGADAGDLRGEDAVYDMLGWENAAFSVELDPPARATPTIQMPWNALVLEGLRRLDEALAVRDTVFQTALETLRGQRGVHSAILATADGLCRATTHAEDLVANATLVARLGRNADALSALLDGGAWEQLIVASPNEKFIVAKRGADYFGCALDARASDAQSKTILRLLAAG